MSPRNAPKNMLSLLLAVAIPAMAYGTEAPILRSVISLKDLQKTKAKQQPKRHGNFARFRPVENKDYFRHVEEIDDKTTIEEIYTPERVRAMEVMYKSSMAPTEKVVNNPYHHARPYEMERYQEQNQRLANWTAKEALSTKLKDLLSHADKDSAPMKVMGAMHSLSNLGNDTAPEQKPAAVVAAKAPTVSGSSTAAKTAEAMEREKALLAASAKPAAKEEEHIPTALKTKLNLVRGRGQVRFQNPVATTSLNLDVKQNVNDRTVMSAADRVTLDVDRHFKELELASNIKYGLERRVMLVNVSKKITDEISANVSSQRFTGEQRDTSGNKSQEAVQMTYSISF